MTVIRGAWRVVGGGDFVVWWLVVGGWWFGGLVALVVVAVQSESICWRVQTQYKDHVVLNSRCSESVRIAVNVRESTCVV
jgi:hypothetical protein